MQKTWRVRDKIEFNKINFSGKYNPLVLQLLFNRRIKTENQIEDFLAFDYEKNVGDPFLFADMEKAVNRIVLAKKNKEKIAIFGDYDADGVTATAILTETMADLGFEDVIIYIPDRKLEGYGLNEEALKYLAEKEIKLVITVDCGMTSIEEIEKAGKDGIEVIITDHHYAPKNLPKAIALINPHVENCGYNFTDLAGVGVAFKLAQALYQKIAPEKIDQLKWLLDLVAIGTIADCVDLLGENRVLVKYGLIVLSKTRRMGLSEMYQVGKISIDENNLPDARKVAFQIAPRINAAGRMDHANFAYGLLTEKDKSKARLMALEIEEKNKERQKVTKEVTREVSIIAENSFKDKKLIFAYSEHWSVGILGLVAGKISDSFNKPTVILQKQEGEFIGSLRSPENVNIIKALEKCSEFIIRFGGHAQAAGVKIKADKIDDFYKKLAQVIEEDSKGIEMVPTVEIDAEISLSEIDWNFVQELKKMEPFGEGNPQPVFLIKKAFLEEVKMVGNGSKHLKMTVREENGSPKMFDAIAFGFGGKFSELKKGNKVELVFNLEEDEWNGNKKIQMKVIDMKM